MGIFLGLLSAFGFGTADFLARASTRIIGTIRTLYYMQFIGLAVLSVYLIMSGELMIKVGTTSVGAWGFALVVALVNVGSSLALYRSFEIGTLSLVSPIAASFGAVAVILALLTGETLSMSRAIGVTAALIGVILASTAPTMPQNVRATFSAMTQSSGREGVGLALLASFGFGFSFWLLGFYVTPELGGVIPVWVSRLTTVTLLTALARLKAIHLAPPPRSTILLLISIGVLDTVGFLSGALGMQSDQVSVVSVLSSLFSAITVVLAWIFLREQLHRLQMTGIGCIFFGVALVSV